MTGSLLKARTALLRRSAAVLLAAAAALSAAAHGAGAQAPAVPRLDHAFVLIMENHAYGQIIGNPRAPFINRMGREAGLATHYTGVTHPSLPNYIAMIAGDYFGIRSDDYPAWGGKGGLLDRRIRPLTAPSLADQLQAAHLSWKLYAEALPAGGAYGVDVSPGGAGGALYAAKHTPFAYFASVQSDKAMMANIVPAAQLDDDLHGHMPHVAFIVPDQCRDMHGDGGPCAGLGDAQLIQAGDRAVAGIVTAIRGSSLWRRGRNAIFLVWDEDNFRGAHNHVAAIVQTSYGPGGLRDATPYTHYSLLKTLEAAFGLGYLGHAADPRTAAMVPLLAPTRTR